MQTVMDKFVVELYSEEAVEARMCGWKTGAAGGKAVYRMEGRLVEL